LVTEAIKIKFPDKYLDVETGMKKRNFKLFISLVMIFIALLASISFYIGYFFYYRYQNDLKNIRNLEKDFPRLEKQLSLAIKFYPLPSFQVELGRLYLLRAMAEIEYGQADKSNPYLDRAEAILKEAISANPLDYDSFWELSKVYFLYNYPLLTYATKGRNICRQAVKRYPANEFLNLNVLFVFFEQWELLEAGEKDWMKSRIVNLQASDSQFLEKLKRKWYENYREAATLESRLKELGL
jgi:tetratricopeptide (TPR) repeat protein